MAPAAARAVERIQTGVRMEKRLVKVLKGLAEYHDMTLGDLLEGIVDRIVAQLHLRPGHAQLRPTDGWRRAK